MSLSLFLQSKDRELAQYRHELQRIRQTITEVISFISSFIQGNFFPIRLLIICIRMTRVS